MLYLGIDQHARQLTISLRDDSGDALQARPAGQHPAANVGLHGHVLLCPPLVTIGTAFMVVALPQRTPAAQVNDRKPATTKTESRLSSTLRAQRA